MDTTPYRILWVEDDAVLALEAALGDAGYIVDHAYFLSDAEECLKAHVYDLVVLDVLMAIEPEDAAIGYTAMETAGGNEAGMVFVRRHAQDFKRRNTGVLVYSAIGDESDVTAKFVDLGVPADNVLYKVSQANVVYLLENIDKILRNMGKKGK
jgi:CheY-like chemotaxis protein